MASGWTKGPVCGIENCRSRLYQEEEDGFQYCQNGHRQGNILRTAEDEDDFDPHRKKHRLKGNAGSEKTYQYYKGNQAFDLFLKCIQLIQRHQIRFLVHAKGLPAELELVILDLWALRIANLQDRVVDAGADESQSQMFSSASEAETESDSEVQLTSRRGRRWKDTPKLIDTLALCYLGLLTLRLPITPGDLYDWITNDKMVYLQAIKAIPEPMKDKLPSQYHASLDPRGILNVERLHEAIIDLAIFYQRNHGISFPPINHPLLLFRTLKELALPLEIYAMTTKLAQILGYTFAFPVETGSTKLRTLDNPQVQLVALLVVSVKLTYPFDGQPRFPRSMDEPATVVIVWEKWCQALSDFKKATMDNSSQMKPGDLMNLTERDVFQMSDNQLDEYLEWYQETWVDERSVERDQDSAFWRAIYDLFPLQSIQEPATTGQAAARESKRRNAQKERLDAVHGSMKARRVVAYQDQEEDIQRPGSGYKIYRQESDLQGPAKLFYAEVARICGLSLRMLVRAVFRLERKIQSRGESRRKEVS